MFIERKINVSGQIRQALFSEAEKIVQNFDERCVIVVAKDGQKNLYVEVTTGQQNLSNLACWQRFLGNYFVKKQIFLDI